jgi:hypothetical protein
MVIVEGVVLRDGIARWSSEIVRLQLEVKLYLFFDSSILHSSLIYIMISTSVRPRGLWRKLKLSVNDMCLSRDETLLSNKEATYYPDNVSLTLVVYLLSHCDCAGHESSLSKTSQSRV